MLRAYRGAGEVEKRGDKFRARFRSRDGKRTSKTFKRERDARRWLREQLSQLDRGICPHLSERSLLNWAETVFDVSAPNLEKATIIARNSSLLRLKRYCPALLRMNLSEIDQTDIQKAINQLSTIYHSGTVRVDVAVLTMLFNKALDDRLIQISPCRKLKVKKSLENHGGQAFTDEERDLLMNYCACPKGQSPTLMQDFVFLQLHVGCRTQEIRALRPEHLVRHGIMIQQSIGADGKPKTVKAGQSRFIPITNEELWERLCARAEKTLCYLFEIKSKMEPISHASIRNKLHGILPNHSPHDFRHDWLTRAVKSGMNTKAISMLSGDRIETILNHYTHISEEDLRKASSSMTLRFSAPKQPQEYFCSVLEA